MVVLVGSCDSVSWSGVGDFIVVFPLDSIWVSWGEFVGVCGLFGCVVYGEWFVIDVLMSVSKWVNLVEDAV